VRHLIYMSQMPAAVGDGVISKCGFMKVRVLQRNQRQKYRSHWSLL
jgi:hypothetical protein